MLRAPTDNDFDALVAENRFVTDIQLAIEKAMRETGFSQVKLARVLGISEPRVSQILGGNGKNLQARTVARIAHVLGRRPFMEFAEDREDEKFCAELETACLDFKKWKSKAHRDDEQDWNQIANDDELADAA